MTFPTFDRILMADVLRDGGSYFMLLSDSSGATTALNLPVQRDGKGIRTGYSAPSLLNHVTDQRAQLTWSEAALLAQVLTPLCDDSVGEGGARRAKECVDFLARSGSL